MASIASANLSRARPNRTNPEHSTGPHTNSGKQVPLKTRSSNGLTAQSPFRPPRPWPPLTGTSSKFLDEYCPATATQSQMVMKSPTSLGVRVAFPEGRQSFQLRVTVSWI
jgi:hypothetical protein